MNDKDYQKTSEKGPQKTEKEKEANEEHSPKKSGMAKGYKVPPSELIAATLMEVMVKHRTVPSQKQLTEYVLTGLRQYDCNYTLKPKRLRRIAFSTQKIRITFRLREDKNHPRYSTCPVCGGKLSKVKNATLNGGKTVVGAKCGSCIYHTTPFRCVPRKYTFTYLEKGTSSESEGLIYWEGSEEKEVC